MFFRRGLDALRLLALAATASHAQQYGISTIAGGAPPPTPVAALNASIGGPNFSGGPTGVATDSAGNVYFGSQNCVFKLDLNGTLTRVAGNSHAAFSGDGGPAVSAELNLPNAMAVDLAGNIYIADAGNDRVRRVDASGIISTAAGNGSVGHSGDGGPAASALLNGLSGVATDDAGNLYILERCSVREVTPTGIITTVVGSTACAYAGDGGPATSAQLRLPLAIAASGAGDLYIADGENIRKVSGGTITRVAGNGTTGDSGDGGPATSAQLFDSQAIAVDRSGNLFIADTYKVRRVSASGIITTVAGGGPPGYLGNGGPATGADLFVPSGIAVDRAGNLFIADWANARVRKVASSGIITSVAGNGSIWYSGDGGPAVSAQMNGPTGLAVDPSGNVFIAETLNERIRRISATGVITTLAGNGTQAYSGDGGPASNAQMDTPLGIALDQAGNVYFSDLGNYRVRKVSPAGIISTVAGNGVSGYSGDGGPATSAQLYEPDGLAVDAGGNLYIADGVLVRKVDRAGIITTFAGNRTSGTSGDGGPATKASLDWAFGLAIDRAGGLFIVSNNSVRRVSPNGIITTVAGDGTQGYSGDGGPAVNAELNAPNLVAVDSAGSLFISDAQNRRVRRVSSSGIITTVAGIGVIGYSGDGQPATVARIAGPSGLAVDASGNVLIADTLNNAVRILKPITPTFSVNSVTSAAKNFSGALSPGEVVVLYGAGLGPSKLVQAAFGSDGLLGTQLSGTTVSFNGIDAPIVYTSSTQIAAVVPYAISGDTAEMVVRYLSSASGAISLPVTDSAPALFTSDGSGWGQAAAVNQDNSINAPSNPAHVGDFISLYATGAGQTFPAGVDGKQATTPYPRPLLPVSVTVGGQPASVLYVGAAPGEVAGMLQINVRIPSGIQVGNNVSVGLQVWNNLSQPKVTIAVSH